MQPTLGFIVLVKRWRDQVQYKPWFTTRLMLGVNSVDATLKVNESSDGLFQTFPVVLIFTPLLKLLQKEKKKKAKKAQVIVLYKMIRNFTYICTEGFRSTSSL